jgi:hypothetical protein
MKEIVRMLLIDIDGNHPVNIIIGETVLQFQDTIIYLN